MQNGSVVRGIRKMHSDIWQFRWPEKTADGKKIYRRRQIGTIEQEQGSRGEERHIVAAAGACHEVSEYQ